MSAPATEPRPSTRRAERGFTRMELLQGLGALALLVLLAGVPQGGGEDEQRLVQSQAHVSRALSTAREFARRTGRPHAVAFDLAGDRLAVVDADGALARHAETDEALLAELDADLLGAEFAAGGDTLVVGADGWPASGGSVVLRAGKHVLELRLDAATGWIDAVGLDG